MQEEEKQEQTTAQWLFPKIFTIIIAVFVIGFGVQTYFLVDALMPSDQMLMKCLTVFSFDGCALIYSIAKQYYPFKSEKSLHAVQVMFRICLTGSAICTALWVLLSADHFNWSLVPPFLVFVAYVLVTCATTVNVLVFYYIWEMETAKKKTTQRVSDPPTQAVPQPAVAPALDMTALLSAMQKMACESAQNAANQATKQLMDKLTVPAPATPPAQPEPQYNVNPKKEPDTEQLAPFQPAPKPNGNGAKQNSQK